MSKYGWVITKDNLDKCVVNTMGPRDISDDIKDKLFKGEGDTFEMYDDDGELYYTGLIIGDFEGFEPLDDFGKPSAGCTRIKINGKEI